MRYYRDFPRIFIFVFGILFSGCAMLGPSEEKIQTLPWENFDKIMIAYNMVEEGKTTLPQLEVLGFDLKKVSGSVEWDEITTRNYLLGNNTSVNLDTLPEGVLPQGARSCLKSEGGCRAWVFETDQTIKRAAGNYLITEKVLGIEEQRRTTGSQMHVKFFYSVKDRIIRFKTHIPKPLVDELVKKKEPLGTFDKLFGIGRRVFCPFC